MLIGIWHSKEEYINLHPDTIIYTMRLTNDWVQNCLCDICWTNKEEVMKHFWNEYHFKEELKYIIMPFRKYIEMHFKEIRGMNPFWDIGRMEFLEKYNEKWNLTNETF